MLINSQCVAEAPSRRAVTAGSRRLATFGLAADMPVQGRGQLAAEAGYLPDLAGAFRLGQLASGPAQPSTLQVSTAKKSTVQNGTYQHNSIQVTRLVPASREGVGPHPGREPGPA